jgi:hypothetical protein
LKEVFMLRFVAFVAVLAFCLSGNPTLATKVQGKIVVSKELRESLSELDEKNRTAVTNGYWKEPNGVVQVDPPFVDPSRDLGVVLIKDGAADRGPDDVVTVKVLAGSLEKNLIVIEPGTRIKFLSVDPYDHELYSPGMKSFPPERQSRNAFRPIDFPKEGVFEIHCKLFSHFKGWIVVTKSTDVLTVDRKGAFTLEEMEPGKYTIKVSHRGAWIHEKSFEITKEREIQVEIKLTPAGKGKAAEKKNSDTDKEKKKNGKKKSRKDK